MTPPKNPQKPLRTRAALTPPTRTPWGGRRLAARYGAALGLEAGDCVGEAWVYSLDPAFPSLVGGAPLASHVQSTLLLKLLDAAEPLSVQIHPSDDYAGLTELQCGKPEAWYVLEREPGAGLFLGFRAGVGEAHVRQALAAGDDLSALMHFVPVTEGDFFVIDAGTPHAIGAGVTLVEPQRVLAGWAGVTYRYWDWNRHYDAAGRPSAAGTARDLHVEHALAVTDWERVTRAGFVDAIRVAAGPARSSSPASAQPLTRLPGAPEPDRGAGPSPVACSDLAVTRLGGTGSCALPDWTAFPGAALFVVEGAVVVDGARAERGATLALEAVGQVAELEGAHALLCAARPG